jgi:enamine deaminase RidA (YjgF/YER057c/UK114 family)
MSSVALFYTRQIPKKMSKTPINTTNAPAARPGLYNQAIVANGVVYCSGSLPVNPKTMAIIDGDIQAHTVCRLFVFGEATFQVTENGTAPMH